MSQDSRSVSLNNIGIIEQSTLNMDGLTVVTGYNNSGKTTVGKALFAILRAVEQLRKNSFVEKVGFVYKKAQEIRENLGIKSLYFRINLNYTESIEKGIREVKSSREELKYFLGGDTRTDFLDEKELIKYIAGLYNEVQNMSDVEFSNLMNDLEDKKENHKRKGVKTQKEKLLSDLKDLYNNLCSDEELIEYANQRIIKYLQSEFNGQILPVRKQNAEGKIEVKRDSQICFDIRLKDNELSSNERTYFQEAYRNVIFIDDVFTIDQLSEGDRSRGYYYSIYSFLHRDPLGDQVAIRDHNKILLDKLKAGSTNTFEEMIKKREAEAVLKKLDEAFPDQVIFADNKYVCSQSKLDVRNLAAGSKMFAIIKMLLYKGELKEDTLLILDEPESHLHPAWQNRFAEIMVLLTKYLNIHILLTTHSPNFLMALEVYARKYKIWDKTNLYCTEQSSEDYMIHYADVKNSIEKAYNKLADPLFELQNMQME